jgi:hypothetical protein
MTDLLALIEVGKQSNLSANDFILQMFPHEEDSDYIVKKFFDWGILVHDDGADILAAQLNPQKIVWATK